MTNWCMNYWQSSQKVCLLQKDQLGNLNGNFRCNILMLHETKLDGYFIVIKQFLCRQKPTFDLFSLKFVIISAIENTYCCTVNSVCIQTSFRVKWCQLDTVKHKCLSQFWKWMREGGEVLMYKLLKDGAMVWILVYNPWKNHPLTIFSLFSDVNQEKSRFDTVCNRTGCSAEYCDQSQLCPG